MHNIGLVFKFSQNKLTIFYNESFTEAIRACSANNEFLLFYIEADDALFYTISDSLPRYGEIFFFSSAKAKRKATANILSDSEFVNVQDLVSVNDSKIFPYKKNINSRRAPLGLIKINLSDLFDDRSKLIVCNSYNLKFKARSSFWRYNIINRNNKPFDTFNITDVKSQISFSVGDLFQLSSSDCAIPLTSNKQIVMKEIPDNQFNLLGYSNKSEVLLIKNLEFPNIKNLTKEKNRDISNIYIYC